ncbi:hypothetical protein EOL70_04275 [Leucothrix sargassi]|nr:hypothetical protein EOL70_04275 [Leucothrix sargassi]
MPVYQISPANKRYEAAANPPVLDRVSFTIDHIHAGAPQDVCSTYEVVKYLVDHQIPVTVFVQATNPSHDYEFDINNARLIYQLSPHLVTLGVHPLHSGHTQAQQTAVHNAINKIIRTVTGETPVVLSYHGSRAGPEPGISYPGIKYARGIGSTWSPGTDDRMNTPVTVFNSLERSFDYTSERNKAGLSSTIFLHTQELTEGSIKKQIFDTYINEVKAQRLQAVPYYDAMVQDFKDGGSTPPVTPPVSPPTTERLQGLRLSASDKDTRSPLKADFKIKQSTGETVDVANDVTTQQFSLPIGRYLVSATARGITQSKSLELTLSKGIHHIFLMPKSDDDIAPTPPVTPTPPTDNTGAMGSIRLSASEKDTRRPIKANFVIKSSTGATITTANNVETKTFRIPAAAYFITATVGSQTVSANVNLTSTQGIHHIFLIPEAGSTPATPPVTPAPTPTPTPPAGRNARMASLRLSASEKETRRPILADFIIEDMSGKLVATAAQAKTYQFKVEEGTYRIKAHSSGNVATHEITLSHTQGRHYIFLLP